MNRKNNSADRYTISFPRPPEPTQGADRKSFSAFGRRVSPISSTTVTATLRLTSQPNPNYGLTPSYDTVQNFKCLRPSTLCGVSSSHFILLDVPEGSPKGQAVLLMPPHLGVSH